MIPSKTSFKFEELTPITGVKPYVIRYWETEFPEIRPRFSEDGTKIYSQKDLKIILEIKDLFFEKKMTIAAAKGLIFNKYSHVDNMDPAEKDEVDEAPSQEVIISENNESFIQASTVDDERETSSYDSLTDERKMSSQGKRNKEFGLQSLAYLQAISQALKKIDDIKIARGWSKDHST